MSDIRSSALTKTTYKSIISGMKGIILTNAYSNNEQAKYQPARLKEELGKLGVKVEIRRLNSFDCKIENGKNLTEISGYDFCVFYDKDDHALLQIEKSGVRCFNRFRAMVDCDDKMMTYIRLSDEGILMPKTFSAPLCYTKNACNGEEVYERLERELGFPMIVKECYGSLGKGVYLVKNLAKLQEIDEKLMYIPHIYQEFVASSYGKDLRVIVVGGKYLGAMKRVSGGGDFRSNIASGGRGEKYDADEKTIKTAEKIARILDLDYCGIDFLFSEQGMIVCEVNSNAFFKEFEAVTGLNVAKEYAKHIISCVE